MYSVVTDYIFSLQKVLQSFHFAALPSHPDLTVHVGLYISKSDSLCLPRLTKALLETL